MATVIRESSQVILAHCDGIQEAEDLIAVFEQVDPDGVHAGAYGINATEDEHAQWEVEKDGAA